MVITSLNICLLCLLQEPFGGVPWVLSAFQMQSHDAARPAMAGDTFTSSAGFAPGVMLGALLKTATKLFWL